jgi:hypothetical protein
VIHKTYTNYRRVVKSYRKSRLSRDDIHTEQVLRETWWLLFVPIWSRITIEKTTL